MSLFGSFAALSPAATSSSVAAQPPEADSKAGHIAFGPSAKDALFLGSNAEGMRSCTPSYCG